MPAYSFKERFVPMVKNGTKTQTIRNFRSHPVKAGDKVSLFHGMRTKNCVRLRPDTVATKVQVIVIFRNMYVALIDTHWLDIDERENVSKAYFDGFVVHILSPAEKDEFAWHDGFRHADEPEKREGCFEMMFSFFREMYLLPFVGNVISWA